MLFEAWRFAVKPQPDEGRAMIDLAAGSSVTKKGLKLINGKSVVAPASSGIQPRAAIPGQGGVIYNEGTLVLKDTEISGGEAFAGGGIYNQTGATLTLESGSIKNNIATSVGGGSRMCIHPVNHGPDEHGSSKPTSHSPCFRWLART